MTGTDRAVPAGDATDLRALVTGASSGIGAAFARALRARGEKLVLVARRVDRLRDLAGELGGEAVATAIPLDLTGQGAAARLEEELARRGIGVDLLVNNAGVGDTGRFLEERPERIFGMVDLNVRALLDLARRFLPPMVARKRGRLINVCSTSAFQPLPYLAVYAASKVFVLSFTEALATELKGTGVRVQCLCPGLTATEFSSVAGTDRVLFNRAPAATAEAVARASLAGLDRGALTVVVGWQNRALRRLQGLFPGSLRRRIAGELFRPR